MTRRVLLAALLLAAGLAGLACARMDRALEWHPKPSPDDGEWAAQRERWTRKANLYDGLTMRVFATATYQAPELRRARAALVAEWKAMTAAERDALLAAEEAEAARFEDFVLSMTTSDPADNDLDSKATDWRLALVSPGAPAVPGAEVVQLRVDTLLRTLYPTIGDFDVVYRVRFQRPEAAAGTYRTLRMAGPRGRIDFDLSVAP